MSGCGRLRSRCGYLAQFRLQFVNLSLKPLLMPQCDFGDGRITAAPHLHGRIAEKFQDSQFSIHGTPY